MGNGQWAASKKLITSKAPGPAPTAHRRWAMGGGRGEWAHDNLESKAWVVLRRFTARWWAHNLSRKVWQWWYNHGKDPDDVAAIADCLRRTKAYIYWQWVRGNRIHFWTFSDKFRMEMQDGTEFFHLTAASQGMVHNLHALVCETELDDRKKVSDK